jgi:mRNA interferase YafQ
MEKRGQVIEKLWSVTDDLIHERLLSPLRRDHPLSGEWADCRDCHIEGGWVLIYRIEPIPVADRSPGGPFKAVRFIRTGTHTDIFKI